MLMYHLFLLPMLCFNYTHQSDGGSQWEEPLLDSAEVDEESAVKEDFPWNTTVTRVFSAAKIVGLQPSLPAPAPVGAVSEGISQTKSPPCIPVADQCSMLRTAWGKKK